MARTTVKLPGTGTTIDFSKADALIASRQVVPRTRGTMFRSTLKWMLSNIKDGERVFIELLRAIDESDQDPRLEALLALWDTQKSKKGRKRDLDDLCEEAGIKPSEAYGWFSRSCFEQCADRLRVQAWMSSADIMQASVERALDVDHGTEERRMIFTALNFLPSPKGTAIQINNTSDRSGDREPIRTSTFEATQRHAASIVRGTRALNPPKDIAGTVVKTETE